MLPNAPQALYWSLTATCMVTGASSSVGSLGAAVAIEREHTKVLCGTDSAALRKLNSGEVERGPDPRRLCQPEALRCFRCRL
jgi:hypothetical protein